MLLADEQEILLAGSALLRAENAALRILVGQMRERLTIAQTRIAELEQQPRVPPQEACASLQRRARAHDADSPRRGQAHSGRPLPWVPAEQLLCRLQRVCRQASVLLSASA